MRGCWVPHRCLVVVAAAVRHEVLKAPGARRSPARTIGNIFLVAAASAKTTCSSNNLAVNPGAPAQRPAVASTLQSYKLATHCACKCLMRARCVGGGHAGAHVRSPHTSTGQPRTPLATSPPCMCHVPVRFDAQANNGLAQPSVLLQGQEHRRNTIEVRGVGALFALGGRAVLHQNLEHLRAPSAGS